MLERVATFSMCALVMSALTMFAFTFGQQYEAIAERERLAKDIQHFGHVYLDREIYSCRVGP